MSYDQVHRMRVEHAADYHRACFGAWGEDPIRVKLPPCGKRKTHYEAYKAPLVVAHQQALIAAGRLPL